MEQKTLSVIERKDFGKGPAKKYKSEGMIPAVIYGHTDPVHILVNAREFGKKFKVVTENTVINLEMGDNTCQVLIKEIQDDILTNLVEHIDFYEIEKGKTLKTHVPIELVGNPIGVKEGGSLEHKLDQVFVECLPKDLPEVVSVDISNLNVGESVHVSDLPISEEVKVLDAAEKTIAVVTAPRTEAVVSDDEEEEAEA